MDATAIVTELALKARAASRSLSTATGEQRSKALLGIADDIDKSSDFILAANAQDMARAQSEKMHPQTQDRLLLTAERIKGISSGVRQVAGLENPLGNIIREKDLPNGLHLEQRTVPCGVVAAVILLASGNAALLRGSSSAAASNAALLKVMRDALAKTSISPEVIQLVPSDDRATVKALLHARGLVDLVIPRGSASLIRMVVDEATVPTIETGAGVCHVYVDEFADLSIALPILINSKTHRPSVCNAAETLLVHSKVAEEFMPVALKALTDAGVILHCDETTLAMAKKNNIEATLATDENWCTEYGVLEMNVGIVASVDKAIDHIAKFGTKHTEAIVTQSREVSDRFIAHSDCAAVMVNTSTRFTDGEQMGFGAEIGISNQKLHARGPMGLEAMTTTTWVVTGTGQIRS